MEGLGVQQWESVGVQNMNVRGHGNGITRGLPLPVAGSCRCHPLASFVHQILEV